MRELKAELFQYPPVLRRSHDVRPDFKLWGNPVFSPSQWERWVLGNGQELSIRVSSFKTARNFVALLFHFWVLSGCKRGGKGAAPFQQKSHL